MKYIHIWHSSKPPPKLQCAYTPLFLFPPISTHQLIWLNATTHRIMLLNGVDCVRWIYNWMMMTNDRRKCCFEELLVKIICFAFVAVVGFCCCCCFVSLHLGDSALMAQWCCNNGIIHFNASVVCILSKYIYHI